ncbi:flavodoxin family protein [Chelativorans sp. ZYF759]|uniref:NAD(P)H-dependent oxidoreductase n=1 Tax=Chelativorans sp. ZYF759 TaxID=2692213 RepID=UPI00145E06A1|nr:NAD(P)H-dependent oxidoreductase [Chelativorans sp. ZYF759]NMG41563.1 flavodoxin family protein [Chelativorans sp. ZYF759]
MRVLVLFSHPVESSYGAALHAKVLESLAAAGHEVDDCDLYAEGFDPVLSRHDRLTYHDVPDNRTLVEPYVQRLLNAEALVIVSPVWNFGFPAMLKGYFDRVWLPGVTFKMDDGILTPSLNHIRKVGAVLTYGAMRHRAWILGDPPRRIVKRVIRGQIRPLAPVMFMAHYDMNRSTDKTRTRFLDKVGTAMARF